MMAAKGVRAGMFGSVHGNPICRVGQNRIYTPYMTVYLVYLVLSLPLIPYTMYIIYTLYIWSCQPYIFVVMMCKCVGMKSV
jgi:hypothetical protein